ncbi:MAG TPA: carboxylating nicotinate-nucleotide diphosphorylase [bacterium]|nr:carboxylating nicotinate-nucleotide diphosphorylase [bacterium]HPN30874.1 carboxylating nicotinate-nucleotide diphosphorylase [bacterium]
MKKTLLKSLIQKALIEDIGSGDITTDSIITGDKIHTANLIAKENGIICGTDAFKETFLFLEPKIKFKFFKNDGDKCVKSGIIAELIGPAQAILKGERVALNIIQHLSGIATLTSKYVEIAGKYGVQIADTRKTLPNLRYLQKYAVTIGGGRNHRMGLYDMALIKDNHIKAAGSISKAVELVRKKTGFSVKIEVETFNLNDVKEALSNRVEVIMLDNFKLSDIDKALNLIDKKAISEISGNVSLDNLEEYCEKKPDIISVGSLTHSVKALDMSLKIK